jgi:predicted NBD/HSP70 family sugar kinase
MRIASLSLEQEYKTVRMSPSRKASPTESRQHVGVPQSVVRLGNERTLMTLLALNPHASNADLARMSNLGAQTTSRILTTLEERGFIVRGEVLRGRRGQPATPFQINQNGAFAIGVEIGWRYMTVLLFSLGGRVLTSIRRSYLWPDGETIVDLVAAEIATIRAGLTPEQSSRLVGIGLATPFFIERHVSLMGMEEAQAGIWRKLDVAQKLREAVGLEVKHYNDGTAATWAAYVKQTPFPSSMAFLQVSTQICSGIVIEGELFAGPNGAAANLGAILTTDEEGRAVMVHDLASILSLRRYFVSKGLPEPTGHPDNWDWQPLEDAACEWLHTAARGLAVGIATSAAMVDLELVVIDAILPKRFVGMLVELIQEHLEQLPETTPTKIRLLPGYIGSSAAAIGAARLTLFEKYFSRSWRLMTADTEAANII